MAAISSATGLRRLLWGVSVVALLVASLTPPTSRVAKARITGDRTGVSRHRIKIGIHAPLTGAVPVPADSVQKGADLYYRWRRARGRPIHGRHVRVVLKNDNFNPLQTRAVCREMAQEDRVFLLMAYGGTRPDARCADFAASHGIPYISTGASRRGFDTLKTYYATSLTFRQQAPLLADFLISRHEAKKQRNAAVFFRGMGWGGAHRRFASAMEKRGASLDYDRALSRNANKADADTVVAEMKVLGIDHAFILTTPIWFLQLLDSAQKQQFRPLWTGVGLTMTLDSVADTGCRNGTLGKARFFSPFPAVINSRRFDPQFRRAVARFYPEGGRGDDLMWHGWATAKMLVQMLELPGRNLTRERFIRFTERARDLRNGITSRLRFTPKDHLGGRSVHLLRARCSKQRWDTAQAFVRDF